MDHLYPVLFPEAQGLTFNSVLRPRRQNSLYHFCAHRLLFKNVKNGDEWEFILAFGFSAITSDIEFKFA
jgi:hypothetical protein